MKKKISTFEQTSSITYVEQIFLEPSFLGRVFGFPRGDEGTIPNSQSNLFLKHDLGPSVSHHKSQTKRKWEEKNTNKNICLLLLFMPAIKTHLIVITYHMCSREQMPQEPKSMTSLNHQVPAVNPNTLAQHCCSSQWAAVLRDAFGFEPRVWWWKVCS